jgi:tetratricopeptide (TPR) repeat protein
LLRQIQLLLGLWWRPAPVMGDILDRGSLLLACISVVVVSVLLRVSFYLPLLVLAAVYVPGIVVIGTILLRSGNIGVAFQRDYSPLLTCVAMAWSAAALPLVLARWTGTSEVLLILAALCLLYFLVLTYFAVRVVFGAGNGASAGIIALSWVPVAAAVLLWGPLSFLIGWIASPFFLFFLIYYLRSEFSDLGASLHTRQNFRRTLDAATLNPHDGEAQYQLGLIYQSRRQYTEAIRRFEAAVAIDRTETDAHFQLGRIAREQGRNENALRSLETALSLDERHSSSEVHREIGAVYLALGRPEDARRELELYTERREYDPEGLYYYGQALDAVGRREEAREMYRRAVEAAKTAPRYRRRFTAKWSRLAQKQLRG